MITTYRQYHLNANPSEPFYIPEFQGGAFDPWGGPGYDACAILTGADFENVFYKHNWASNAKLINYYMFYGYALLTPCRDKKRLTPRRCVAGRAGVEFPTPEYIQGALNIGNWYSSL